MVLEILCADLITLIQSILLIISAIVIIIASLGVLNLDKNMHNVVYARVHILGMIDVAGIVAFLALGQPLFAVLYLLLAPFLAHAMVNAYFYGEDDYNALNAADMVGGDNQTSDAADRVDNGNEADMAYEENAEEALENLDSGDD